MWILIEIVYGVYCCMVLWAKVQSLSNSHHEQRQPWQRQWQQREQKRKHIQPELVCVCWMYGMKWFYVNWNSNNNQFSGVKSFPFPCWPFQFWWLFRWLQWWQQKNILSNSNGTLHSNGYNGGVLLVLARPFLFLLCCAITWINTPIFLLPIFFSLDKDKQWTNEWTHNFWCCYCAPSHTQTRARARKNRLF